MVASLPPHLHLHVRVIPTRTSPLKLELPAVEGRLKLPATGLESRTGMVEVALNKYPARNPIYSILGVG